MFRESARRGNRGSGAEGLLGKMRIGTWWCEVMHGEKESESEGDVVALQQVSDVSIGGGREKWGGAWGSDIYAKRETRKEIVNEGNKDNHSSHTHECTSRIITAALTVHNNVSLDNLQLVGRLRILIEWSRPYTQTRAQSKHHVKVS
jgi:hypothetical protein